MGKDAVFDHYRSHEEGKTKKYTCNFCDHVIVGDNRERVMAHLAWKCENIEPGLKDSVKRRYASIYGLEGKGLKAERKPKIEGAKREKRDTINAIGNRSVEYIQLDPSSFGGQGSSVGGSNIFAIVRDSDWANGKGGQGGRASMISTITPASQSSGMGAATAGASPCLAFVQRVTRAFLRTNGHDAACYPSLHIHTATPGHILGTLVVESRNVNRLGTMHGGVICSLTDTMGSLALASKGLYSTGVSTDIHTTFVAPARKGEEVQVEGRVVSLGKTLATTRMEMRSKLTNDILAYGSHTKFVGKANTSKDNVEFDETGENVVKGKKPEEWADD